MSRVITIKGKPREYEAVQPNLVGFLFGSNSYLFNIDVDEASRTLLGDILGRKSPRTVPVRVDSLFRCPAFDNMFVEITGEFDQDLIFRANYVKVDETSLLVRGVLRLDMLIAIALVVFFLLASTVGSYMLWGSLREGFGDVSKLTIYQLVGSIISFLIIAFIYLVAWIYIARVAIPSIVEVIERWMGGVISYSPSEPAKKRKWLPRDDV